jgi:hypothetical protein
MSDLPGWAVDAADIPDTACVVRRVPLNQTEDYLPNTGNFRQRDEDASSGLSVTYWQSDADLDDLARPEPTFGIISIVVADIRSCGLIVVRTPLVGNLNHCEIFGNISKSMRKKLKQASLWVCPPQNTDVEKFVPLAIYQDEWVPRLISNPEG